MWYIILTIVLLLIYFLRKSKSDFFKQDRETLAEYRYQLRMMLNFKGRNESEIDLYIEAYDFFCRFTTKFDGATIVKDLCDLPKLDIDAMLHDYECLIGANRNLIKWFKSAWNYFENMCKNGKGNQIFRFVLVCLAGFFFVPYCALFTPKYYPIKKQL
jgi:hypothetical protein